VDHRVRFFAAAVGGFLRGRARARVQKDEKVRERVR
jgi:hypothetical protein